MTGRMRLWGDAARRTLARLVGRAAPRPYLRPALQQSTVGENSTYRAKRDGTQKMVGPDYEPRPWKWETVQLPAGWPRNGNLLLGGNVYIYAARQNGKSRRLVWPESHWEPQGAGPSHDFLNPWMVSS